MTAALTLDTPENHARLNQLEIVVQTGKRTFVEVGLALLEIRDQRLYRLTHDTWDEYCRDKWGWSRSYGYRLINAAQFAQSAQEITGMLPVGNIQNERQARALAAIAPEQQETILQQAGLEGPLTTDDIQMLVDKEFDKLPPEVQKELIDVEERELLDAADQDKANSDHAPTVRPGKPARKVGGADEHAARRALLGLLQRAVNMLGQVPDVADRVEELLRKAMEVLQAGG